MNRVIYLLVLLAACSRAPNAPPGEDCGENCVGGDVFAVTGKVYRPPQYVALAFDGSLNLAFCKESRAFAKAAGVKFTYFKLFKQNQPHEPHELGDLAAA